MLAIIKKLKNGHRSVNIDHTQKFQITDPPSKVWVSGLPHESPMCSFYTSCYFVCYCPQQSWGKVMFLHVSVILFTGGSAPLHAGIHTHPPSDQRQAPPGTRPPRSRPPRANSPPGPDPQEQTHLPRSRPPPPSRHPPGADTSHPREQTLQEQTPLPHPQRSACW